MNVARQLAKGSCAALLVGGATHEGDVRRELVAARLADEVAARLGCPEVVDTEVQRGDRLQVGEGAEDGEATGVVQEGRDRTAEDHSAGADAPTSSSR